MARPTKLLGLALLSAVLMPIAPLAGGVQPLRAAQAGNRSLLALAATSGSNGVVGLAAPPGLGNGYLAPLEQLRGVGDRFLVTNWGTRPVTVEEPVPLAVDVVGEAQQWEVAPTGEVMWPLPSAPTQSPLSGVVGWAAPEGLGDSGLRGLGDKLLAFSSRDASRTTPLSQQFVPAQVAQNESAADRKARADALFNESLRFWRISDYQSAWERLQQALALYREAEVQRAFPDQSRRGEANTLTGLGVISDNLGRYPQALEYYEDALALQRTIQDRRGVGQTLNNIGAVYDNLGQYEAALGFYQDALVIRQDIGDRAGVGQTLNNIGLVYRNLGQYETALGFYQDALVIFQEIDDRAGEGVTLNNIGVVYRNLGQYETALGFYQDALVIRQEVGDRAGEGVTLNNIGAVYDNLGQYETALGFYQDALVIRQDIGDRAGEGATLNNIGGVYSYLGQYETALGFYQDALVISQEVGDRAGEGATLNNIGLVYDNLGQYETALGFYQDALVILQEIGNRVGVGQTLNNIGLVYRKQGQYETALGFYQDALVISQEIGDRRGRAIRLNNIGYVLEALTGPQLAIVFFKESVNQWEAIRGDIRGLDTEDQQAFTDSVADTYRKLADLLLQQDRILEAQRVLDLLKVQELDEYLDGVRSTDTTERGVDPLGAERQIASRTVLGGYELAQLRQIPISDLSQAQRQRLAELDAAQRQVIRDFRDFIDSPEIQALVAQLETDIQQDLLTELDEFDNLQNDLADIQRQTGQTAVMVYPLILEDRLELVLITPFSEPSRYPVTVDQTELNEAILAFRQALDDPRSDPRPLAQQLYRWLVEPMAADLEAIDAETILYAPDGKLRYIPLAALHDGEQWLAERFAVNHITAASLQSLTVRPNPEPTILAAAFSEGFFEIQTAQRTFAFGGLPYAGVEVAELAAQFPGTTELTNRDFSRAAVEPFMDSHTIVHLATHAAFVPGLPRDSFILFGNGDTLTLQEIKDDWDGRFNRIDLIVLSACETGVGGPALGNGEEILGFGYLMQEAGAAAAIASLWVVSDGGTQALMEAFYLALQNGYSKTEALQRAQQALIADDLALVGGEGTVRAIARPTAEDGRALGSNALPGYRHPYYWAPFILIGNGL
jgi:CHAT domain-containing protein/Tfp pilus assembly protein PilF